MVALDLADVIRDEFPNRRQAGQWLALALQRRLAGETRPLRVLAIPRGGVPVACEVAKALQAPLDLLFVRKLAAPELPALSLGAVVRGPGTEHTMWNRRAIEAAGACDDQLAALHQRHREALEQACRRYPAADAAPMRGCVLLLVDDGVATGATMRAALQAMAAQEAARLMLAVPVAPDGIERRLQLPDEDFVCLFSPGVFSALAHYYADFDPVSDDEACGALQAFRREAAIA